MKSGKINNFKNFHMLNDKKLKYLDKIKWNHDLSKEHKLKIDEILINMPHPIESNYTNYKILGYILTDYEHIYLITDNEYKLLYVSVGKSHPNFWYKFTTRKEFIDTFDEIYETYNKQKYSFATQKKVRVFIGSEDILSIDIHDIENHLLLQKYTDKLIYGSLWDDHPFRKEYNERSVDLVQSIILTGQAMRQEEDEAYNVSVRTVYSKSLITIYDYNDAFILEVSYNPIQTKHIQDINMSLHRSYNTDIPIDVIISILEFPFISHTELIKMRPLTKYHMFIIDLLIMGNSNIAVDLESEFKLLLDNKDTCNKDHIDESIYDDMTTYLKLISNYKLFVEIIKDKKVDDFIKNGDPNNLEKLVMSLAKKYKCVDNKELCQELEEFVLMHFDNNDTSDSNEENVEVMENK